MDQVNSNLVNDDETRYPTSGELIIQQPLYRGGRTVAETARAENDVQAERARLISVEQQVLLDSGTAYVNVIAGLVVVDLSINNEKVLGRQLEATQDRFSVGEVTRTDVSQAEARLARATADRVITEGFLQNARANYERNIGEPPGDVVRPENFVE